MVPTGSWPIGAGPPEEGRHAAPAKLYQVAAKYIRPEQFRPDSGKWTEPDLLADVKAFDRASRAGEYYEMSVLQAHSRGVL